jgi:hypothetical protein
MGGMIWIMVELLGGWDESDLSWQKLSWQKLSWMGQRGLRWVIQEPIKMYQYFRSFICHFLAHPQAWPNIQTSSITLFNRYDWELKQPFKVLFSYRIEIKAIKIIKAHKTTEIALLNWSYGDFNNFQLVHAY